MSIKDLRESTERTVLLAGVGMLALTFLLRMLGVDVPNAVLFYVVAGMVVLVLILAGLSLVSFDDPAQMAWGTGVLLIPGAIFLEQIPAIAILPAFVLIFIGFFSR